MTELSDIFRGLQRAYKNSWPLDERREDGKVEQIEKWIREAPTEDTWQAHLFGQARLAITPVDDDGLCWFGVLDVDIYSEVDHAAFSKRIAEAKLPLVTCSTKSGGLHFYLFTSAPVKASVMRTKLAELGASIGLGDVEVFPKQSKLASDTDVGNAINLPYFGALNDETTADTMPRAWVDGRVLSLDGFITHVEHSRVSPDDLSALKMTEPDDLLGAPPCIIAYVNAGAVEARNNALFHVGVYYSARYDSVDDRDHAIEDFNANHMEPRLSRNEVNGVISGLNKKSYNYKCNDVPMAAYCNKKVCRAQKYGIKDNLVEVENLTKLTKRGEDPSWIVTISGERYEVDTDTLLKNQLFIRFCMQHLGRVPPATKQNDWNTFLDGLVQNAETIDVSIEETPTGRMLMMLQEYCRSPAARPDKEQLLPAKKGVWLDEDNELAWFKSAFFFRWLTKQQYREMRQSEITKEFNRMVDNGELRRKQLGVNGHALGQCYGIKPEALGDLAVKSVGGGEAF